MSVSLLSLLNWRLRKPWWGCGSRARCRVHNVVTFPNHQASVLCCRPLAQRGCQGLERRGDQGYRMLRACAMSCRKAPIGVEHALSCLLAS